MLAPRELEPAGLGAEYGQVVPEHQAAHPSLIEDQDGHALKPLVVVPLQSLTHGPNKCVLLGPSGELRELHDLHGHLGHVPDHADGAVSCLGYCEVEGYDVGVPPSPSAVRSEVARSPLDGLGVEERLLGLDKVPLDHLRDQVVGLASQRLLDHLLGDVRIFPHRAAETHGEGRPLGAVGIACLPHLLVVASGLKVGCRCGDDDASGVDCSGGDVAGDEGHGVLVAGCLIEGDAVFLAALKGLSVVVCGPVLKERVVLGEVSLVLGVGDREQEGIPRAILLLLGLGGLEEGLYLGGHMPPFWLSEYLLVGLVL